MAGLALRWTWHESQQSGLAFSKRNVWSRSARRKRQRAEASTESKSPSVDDRDETDVEESAALVVRITLSPESEVRLRWLKGTDAVLYESFCGMMKRALLSN